MTREIQSAICVILLLSGIHVTFAALPPAIEWQRSYGGTNDDIAFAVERTPSGDFILAGIATIPDFWLLRGDPAGTSVAEIRQDGGGNDIGTCCKALTDGGFYLGGYSYSGAGGSKTSTNFGRADFWVLRLNASGSKIWDASFGGNGEDYLQALAVSEDGGCLLGGTAYTSTGGNKTSPAYGGGDYWVVRLGYDGSKLWEKSFGTTNTDDLRCVLPAAGGGFLLAGFSPGVPFGTTGGNRTSTGFGNNDFWIVRTDAAGNRLWEGTYGGSSSDVLLCAAPTADGGFVLGGRSHSAPSGTKTSPSYGTGDYWLVRIDANGQQLWDRSYGGDGQDDLMSIEQVAGGFILAGRSTSGISGNKTTVGYGIGDYWIVRVDANGDKLWELTVGGTADDWPYAIRQMGDGGWVVAGYSASGANGNKTTLPLGPTTGQFGVFDAWAVKIGPDELTMPPRLRWDDDGLQWSLILKGASNMTYRTDVSTDLVNWQIYQTNRMAASEVVITQGSLTFQPRGFFRALLLP
jgi:hypothetical protein